MMLEREEEVKEVKEVMEVKEIEQQKGDEWAGEKKRR